MAAPPILPLYKTQLKSNHSKEAKKGWAYYCILLGLIILPILLLFLFFVSIYLGTSYLQSHLQMETSAESANFVGNIGIGLPNTRNIIKKWSINYLNGIDITALGPPPQGVQALSTIAINSTTSN